MRTYHLHCEQFVGKPQHEVFAFFERPENLARITPSTLGFVIKTPLPIEMKAGAMIDYTIKISGMRVGWQTLISEYNPPHKFVDEQLKGPYRIWHHTHQFVGVEGGTRIVDDIRYALPLGFLGSIAHFLFVRRQLEGIFRHREQVIKSFFS